MKKIDLPKYSIPHLVHIEMTYSCNSKCFFCYNPYRDSPIDYSQIDKIVESVSKSKIPHVYLIGGEPSLLEIGKLNEYIEKLSVNSSVTIVTNGLKYMNGLSKKLACLGVAIHGDPKTQEWLSGIRGGYDRTIENVKRYVKDGFDVRCIPVLTSKNYDQIYEIIKLSKVLGMESVFVDKFEIGGMGLDMASQLKPSLEDFKKSLDQMIKARDDFNIPVGFGTAIPYCLDERLIKENMFANCGVGVTFGAVNPNGDFRICNQSEIVYGNVLKETIEEIWNKKSLDDFRNLGWVGDPCTDCILVGECTGGCKVDLSCSSSYCIDYHIRENRDMLVSPKKITKLWELREKSFLKNLDSNTFPGFYREYRVDPFCKVNDCHEERYIVTRYQTVVVDKLVYSVMEALLHGFLKEKDIIEKFSKDIEEEEIRKLLSNLEDIGAIHSKKIRTIDWEITKDCNLKCKHCITSSPAEPKGVDCGLMIRAINMLYENGLEEVSITGGEPLAYPGIRDLFSYLKDKGISVRFITNGTLLTKELINGIKDFVSEVAISIDGVREDANDFIRGKGNFKKVMQNIELLRSCGIMFSLYFTLHEKNRDIEEMVKFSKKIGAEYCRINQISKRGRALSCYEDNFNTKVDISPSYQAISRVCDLAEDSMFIDSIGQCYPCVELSQINGTSLGNIFEDNVDDIYLALRKFCSANKNNPCPYSILKGDYETICLNNNINCGSK